MNAQPSPIHRRDGRGYDYDLHDCCLLLSLLDLRLKSIYGDKGVIPNYPLVLYRQMIITNPLDCYHKLIHQLVPSCF